MEKNSKLIVCPICYEISGNKLRLGYLEFREHLILDHNKTFSAHKCYFNHTKKVSSRKTKEYKKESYISYLLKVHNFEKNKTTNSELYVAAYRSFLNSNRNEMSSSISQESMEISRDEQNYCFMELEESTDRINEAIIEEEGTNYQEEEIVDDSFNSWENHLKYVQGLFSKGKFSNKGLLTLIENETISLFSEESFNKKQMNKIVLIVKNILLFTNDEEIINVSSKLNAKNKLIQDKDTINQLSLLNEFDDPQKNRKNNFYYLELSEYIPRVLEMNNYITKGGFIKGFVVFR